MFGGLGIWREGIFFALIDDNIMYFKVDAGSRPEYARLNSEPFSYQIVKQGVPNLKIIDSLWRVPDLVLDEPDMLFAWAQQAYEAARTRSEKPTRRSEVNDNSIHEFKSLSRKSLLLLREIGIASHQTLREVGTIDAYRQLKARYPKAVTLNLFWALYAVVSRVRLEDVTPDIKAQLKDLLEALSE